MTGRRITPEPILIKGAGELASGVAASLHAVGCFVFMTEIHSPLAVRRRVCFSEAVYDGLTTVEGIVSRMVNSLEEAVSSARNDEIPVFVDPQARISADLKPLAVIDAIMAKANRGTRLSDAAIVLALGPGFTAGKDALAVIETNRGHDLGRIIWDGSASPDTATPAPVAGRGQERVLRAPLDGVIQWDCEIGHIVTAGQRLGTMSSLEMLAPFDGVLRGLIRPGIEVAAGTKIGDVDPRIDIDACFTISDKARAIGGATLQALLIAMRKKGLGCYQPR